MAMLNMKQYGQRIGVSRQRVSALIKTGQITAAAIVKKGKRTLINPSKADDDLRRTLDPSKSKAVIPETEKRETIQAAGLDTDSRDYQQSRALHEYYRASLKKLEYDAKAGDLVDRVTVETEAFECARTVRDAMQAIPNRLSAVLAAETDADRVEKALRDEIRTALTALSDSM